MPRFLHDVKRLWCDFDHHLHPSAEVMNEWIYTPVPPVRRYFVEMKTLLFTNEL
jgi:hypothetical protein